MPRSGGGVYTLPQAPFTPNTVIQSSVVNSDFSDIATALTQSLATTGVSSMTGAIKGFSGSQLLPGYAFASALSTGWFLSGTNEISVVNAGVVTVIFGASTTVTYTGNVIYAGGFNVTGSVTVGSNLTVVGSLSGSTGNFSSSLHATGPISTSASMAVTGGLYVNATLQASGNIVASSSVTFTGPLRVSTSVSVSGGLYITGSLNVAGGSLGVSNDAALLGNTNNIGPAGGVVNLGGVAVVISTTSVEIAGFAVLDKQASDPTTVAASKLAFYVKADGFSSTPAPYFQTSASVAVPLMFTGGQCQLTKSGTSLLLSPFGGNRLTVNGVPCIVPDVGVSLPASNSAATFVYIYAVAINGAVTSLEMSTTVPIQQAGTGVKQKTGDATRTLVGAAYTDAGGAWADTDGKLWVLSYFNRRRKNSTTFIQTALAATAAITYIEVNASMRNNFISWNDEIVNLYSFLSISFASLNTVISANNIDGATNSGANNTSSAGPLSGAGITTDSVITGVTENTTHYGTIFVRAIAATTYQCPLGLGGTGSSALEGTKLYINVNG